MAKVLEIIEKIENIAPLDSAESWDNTGWQLNLNNLKTNKIMLCLSVLPEVVEQAIEKNCDMIIAHHPLIFPEIKNLNSKTLVHKALIMAIQNNIQVYSCHTNFDKAQGGTSDTLAKALGINVKKTQCDFIKTGTIKENTLEELILKIKNTLGNKELKVINPKNKTTFETIGVGAGACADFINKIECDVFITGDIKYHNAIETIDKIVIDAGHYETESISLPILQELLHEDSLEIFIADEKQAWEIL